MSETCFRHKHRQISMEIAPCRAARVLCLIAYIRYAATRRPTLASSCRMEACTREAQGLATWFVKPGTHGEIATDGTKADWHLRVKSMSGSIKSAHITFCSFYRNAKDKSQWGSLWTSRSFFLAAKHGVLCRQKPKALAVVWPRKVTATWQLRPVLFSGVSLFWCPVGM